MSPRLPNRGASTTSTAHSSLKLAFNPAAALWLRGVHGRGIERRAWVDDIAERIARGELQVRRATIDTANERLVPAP